MYLFITNIICLKRKTHPSFLSFSICQRMRNPVVCVDITYQMFIKEDPFNRICSGVLKLFYFAYFLANYMCGLEFEY